MLPEFSRAEDSAMKRQIVYMIIVLASRLLSIVKCSSCEDDNQKRVYCTKSGVVRQKMCLGVAPFSCSTGSWPCACKEDLYRSSDGVCVQKRKCDPMYRTPKPRTTKFPRGTYIPGGAVKVLQKWKKLVRVATSTKRWLGNDCFCMDSDHVADFPPRNVVRTVSCKIYSKFGKFNNVMMKFTAQIMFELGVEDGVTVFYLRRYKSDTNRIPFDIPKKLNVLYANGDCIVLQFTGTKKDQEICSLWGPQNASGVDEQVCFNTFNKDCPGEKTFSYLQERDRCDLHDKLAQTYGKKPRSK
ncbi:uncharacterized protein LOC119453404 isoform X2 [Dermacentor silvarum]|uniref:uncharacterized protein LOC119453404 isoform X2 n=1 Tax=Dermacentor silvarum TaxID=543639 RepID=UPI00210111C7|nr:uncharacterized protein LOC119453404 isoform X2 [Dermacentor silvarum]